MELSGNTVLVAGGGTGIGRRGLAGAFHRLGNDVVIVGRRDEPLAAVAKASVGHLCVRLPETDAVRRPHRVRRDRRTFRAAWRRLGAAPRHPANRARLSEPRQAE